MRSRSFGKECPKNDHFHDIRLNAHLIERGTNLVSGKPRLSLPAYPLPVDNSIQLFYIFPHLYLFIC